MSADTRYPEMPERIVSTFTEHDWVYAATLMGEARQVIAQYQAGLAFDADCQRVLDALRAFQSRAQ